MKNQKTSTEKYDRSGTSLLIQEWNKTELPVLEKLVDSVPSRLYGCIKMKDYPTKY